MPPRAPGLGFQMKRLDPPTFYGSIHTIWPNSLLTAHGPGPTEAPARILLAVLPTEKPAHSQLGVTSLMGPQAQVPWCHPAAASRLVPLPGGQDAGAGKASGWEDPPRLTFMALGGDFAADRLTAPQPGLGME